MKTLVSRDGLSLLAIAAVGLTILSAHAQSVPPLINYQGRFANSDGTPFPTADYSLAVRIWSAPTNGTLVWGPQLFDGAAGPGHGPRIPVVQGYFNLMLGPVDTNGVSIQEAFAGPERFVEVTISNRPALLPRQRIVSAPFAMSAGNSMTLAGFDWTALMGANDPTAGPVLWSKLPGRREIGPHAGIGGVAVSDVIRATSNPTTLTKVDGMFVSLVTSGRPVIVTLVPEPPPQPPPDPHGVDSSRFGFYNNSEPPQLSSTHAIFAICRNDTNIVAIHRINTGLSSLGTRGIQLPAGALQTIDWNVGSATNTYCVKVAVERQQYSTIFWNVRLMAYEL